MDEHDLFERHEDMPAELQAVTSKYSELLESGEIDRYEVCKQFLADVEALGYTFSYGLEGEPHSLRQAEPGELDEDLPVGPR